MPSSASKDHGAPFAEVFARYGGDFYKIDPLLFSPAEVEFRNLKTGRCHRFGKMRAGAAAEVVRARMMRIAILSGGTGWHVQDLLRAAGELGHRAEAVDFRSLAAGVEAEPAPLAGFDAVLVRTMPAGSLEQVVFRMDVLHAAAARGVPVLNPPRAVETCVDKYLTNVRLAAAGLPTPPTLVAQRADDALEAFARSAATWWSSRCSAPRAAAWCASPTANWRGERSARWSRPAR